MKCASGLILAATLVLGGVTPAGAESNAPAEVIRRAAENVRQVLAGKVKKGSPAEEKRKQELKKVVDSFLDYARLSEMSLGPHWKDRTEQERREFISLLRDLIEASYTSTIEDNIQFKLGIEEEQIEPDGSRATVVSVAKAKNKKGREVGEDLTFQLYLQGGKWLIYDVEFGDVSLVRHYRGEFNRKIKKESYAALISAMKKKLSDIRAGKVKIGDKPPPI